MRINYDRTILDENFFTKFQQLGLICNTFHMFDELDDIFDRDNDNFKVEYDETVDKHILLHVSDQFKETRPICYLDMHKFEMKVYHQFIIACLRESWAEYTI